MICVRDSGLSGGPEAPAKSAWLLAQNATTVNTHRARIRMADASNQNRYNAGVRQPQISAPIAPTKVSTEVGAKNCPGIIGNRAPYGSSERDSGGAALQAPARTIKS